MHQTESNALTRYSSGFARYASLIEVQCTASEDVAGAANAGALPSRDRLHHLEICIPGHSRLEDTLSLFCPINDDRDHCIYCQQ